MKGSLIALVVAGCTFAAYAQTQPKPAGRPVYGLLDSCKKFSNRESYEQMLGFARKGYQMSLRFANDSLASAFSAYVGDGLKEAGKLDSAILYYRLSERHAYKINNANLTILAQKDLVNVFEAKGMSDSVYALVNAVEAHLPAITNDKVKSQITSMLGATYTAHNNYEKAITYYIANIKYNSKIKNDTGIGMALVNIGNCYLQMSNNKKALDYFREAMPHLNGYIRAKIICGINLGVTFINLNIPDSAVKYLQGARQLAHEKKDSVEFYSTGGKLGLALIAKKAFGQAKALLQASLDYARRRQDVVAIADGYTFLGNLAHAQKQYDLATFNFKTALKYAQRGRYAERETEIYRVLAENEASAKRYKEAFNYESRFTAENDSLNRESAKSSITELESSFQNQKKQQQINLLVHQQKEKEAQLLVQTRTKYFLLAGLFMVLIIVGLIWRAYSLKQVANKIFESKNLELEDKNLELQNVNGKLDEANRSKSKLFSILSHDLRAPINSVFQFVTLQKDFSEKLSEADQKKHGEHILNSADNLLNSMEDLLIWSKSQMESFSLNPQTVEVKHLVQDVFSLLADFAEKRKITLELETQHDLTITTDLNFLKIVLRNIIGNGIKFTEPNGRIDVQVHEEGNMAYFSITDTGLGMTPVQLEQIFEWSSIRSDSSGLGLKLAKEFTERLGGRIQVESSPGIGTTFTIAIPSLKNVTA